MQVTVGSKRLTAAVTTALDVSGREHLVIVAKASWSIPEPGQRPRPLPPQPLAYRDRFAGEAGASALLYGTDFARFKPRCDVLFAASAYAPPGPPVTELLAGWRIGRLQKVLRVLGPRVWQRRFGRYVPGAPQPFDRLPLHYGYAFGGTRYWREGRGDPARVLAEALPANPVGIGWAGPHTRDIMEGAPAPRLEYPDDPIRKPTAAHRPAAFSALARHWRPMRAPMTRPGGRRSFHSCRRTSTSATTSAPLKTSRWTIPGAAKRCCCAIWRRAAPMAASPAAPRA